MQARSDAGRSCQVVSFPEIDIVADEIISFGRKKSEAD